VVGAVPTRGNAPVDQESGPSAITSASKAVEAEAQEREALERPRALPNGNAKADEAK
jgi:hypothetical protein